MGGSSGVRGADGTARPWEKKRSSSDSLWPAGGRLSRARDVAHPIGGLIYPKAQIEELFRIFETDRVAIVVDSNELVGIISKIDLIDYLSRRNSKGAGR